MTQWKLRIKWKKKFIQAPVNTHDFQPSNTSGGLTRATSRRNCSEAAGWTHSDMNLDCDSNETRPKWLDLPYPAQWADKTTSGAGTDPWHFLKKITNKQVAKCFFPWPNRGKNCFNVWTALVFFKVIITLWDNSEYKIYQITYRDFNR